MLFPFPFAFLPLTLRIDRSGLKFCWIEPATQLWVYVFGTHSALFITFANLFFTRLQRRLCQSILFQATAEIFCNPQHAGTTPEPISVVLFAAKRNCHLLTTNFWFVELLSDLLPTRLLFLFSSAVVQSRTGFLVLFESDFSFTAAAGFAFAQSRHQFSWFAALARKCCIRFVCELSWAETAPWASLQVLTNNFSLFGAIARFPIGFRFCVVCSR